MMKRRLRGEAWICYTTSSMDSPKNTILFWRDISMKDVPLVGGKNASLGEMYRHLTKKGVRIPNGFAVSAHVYRALLEQKDVKKTIKTILKDLDVTHVGDLAKRGKKIRALLLSVAFPKDIQNDITLAYRALCKEAGIENASVAVRSSATAEDLPDASFAGQQETYLNVQGEKELLSAVKKCIASLYTTRAISYREAKGFDHLSVALSVGVQLMVRSDVGASGVMFTLDTESGFPGVILMNASYGLGEYVVKGRVTPDQFYVFKDGVRQEKKAVISRTLGAKDVKLVYGTKKGTRHQIVAAKDRNRFAISDDEVVQLAAWGMIIEDHYGRAQDIEWAKDGETGKLFIVQARPETVKARSNHAVIEEYHLKKKGNVLLSGTAVGQKIGAGKARVIDDPKGMSAFRKGEVLVTRLTDPDWEPIMRMAAAIVTEEGGKTSHAAIVSRELGVPCIVGAGGARGVLHTGEAVTVSCAEGETGRVYRGILPFEVERTNIAEAIDTKTKIMMNVGDPDHAFALSFLPNDGVGLAREEFIFTNFIRIHPLALLKYNQLKDKAAKKKIAELTRGYAKKSQYCVDKLAEGMARIAVSVYPRPVILRLSDFKTNEYAALIGGKEFEPKEENPMLGWRGASRYYSKAYKDGFRLECEAIKKARNEWGLNNIIAMIPFCRTPEEGEKVLETMAEFGLKRGENGLEVYVMCEIPSNVILAAEFARIFDGFSIGSNDLTQLTLGVDRDSAAVSHVYNEKNDAVETLISDVIRVAHRHKRKVGICGQAPSDSPEFAEFLVRAGIDSISLNPDTVVATKKRIHHVEKTVGRMGKKTSARYLTMVVSFGLLAASMIGLGAGCGESRQELPNSVAEISPALVREMAVKKVLAEKEKEQMAGRATLTEKTFANFTLQYPAWWSVEHWQGGVTLRDTKNGDYASVFVQLVSHPVPQEKKQSVTVGGIAGSRYDEGAVHIAELPIGGGDMLEVNGSGAAFDDILASIAFPKDAANLSRPASHWDVRERRLCVQMITYARQNKTSACAAYSTPCDVPVGWEVCDAGDVIERY